MRLAPWVVLAIASLGCGGAGRESGATASAPLGVQSNVSRTHDVLRLRPGGPMAFATSLRVHVESEMMGEPMSADFDTRGVRRVLGVLDDGSLSMEELETQTRYAITMMGSTRTGPDDASLPVARHYVLGDRGRRIETPRSAPSAAAPGTEMQDQLEMALDPLVRALEFPEGAVSPGEQWATSGRIPFGELDPALAGEATYQVAQRLERFEGSGENRVAVISFEGTLEGAGTSTAPPGQHFPGQPMPMPGQPMPGMPGEPMPGMPGEPMPGMPGEPMPGMPGEPMPGMPGEPMQGMPGQPMPGQPMPGQPMPGQPMPGQPMPGQPMPGQPMPGQPMPGQPMPGQPMPGQPMDMARIAGEVRFRGFYVAAVSDGFARTAQADFEGQVQLGEGGILTFPLRGELEWTATPIVAGLSEAAAASGQPDAGAL